MPDDPRAVSPVHGEGETSSLVRVAVLLLTRWKTLAAVAAAAAGVAVVIGMLQPERSTVWTLLVPAVQPNSSGISALADQLPAGLAGLAGNANNSPKVISVVLGSRALADAVVNAVAGEDTDTAEEAHIRDIVGSQTEVSIRPDGSSVAIGVTAADAEIAAQIANAYAPALNRVISRMALEASDRKVEFLKQQLTSARENLLHSEEQIQNFQRSRDVPEIREQASRTLSAAAELQQRISEKELQLAQLRRTLAPNNPQLRAAAAELNDLRGQLSRLTSRGSGVFVPLTQGPELRMAATRLERELRRDEQIYVSLTAALAQAQIDANSSLPVLTVLDPAMPPGSPAGPPLWLRAAMGAVLGLLAGIALVLLQAGWRHFRQQPWARELFHANSSA